MRDIIPSSRATSSITQAKVILDLPLKRKRQSQNSNLNYIETFFKESY